MIAHFESNWEANGGVNADEVNIVNHIKVTSIKIKMNVSFLQFHRFKQNEELIFFSLFVTF